MGLTGRLAGRRGLLGLPSGLEGCTSGWPRPVGLTGRLAGRRGLLGLPSGLEGCTSGWPRPMGLTGRLAGRRGLLGLTTGLVMLTGILGVIISFWYRLSELLGRESGRSLYFFRTSVKERSLLRLRLLVLAGSWELLLLNQPGDSRHPSWTGTRDWGSLLSLWAAVGLLGLISSGGGARGTTCREGNAEGLKEEAITGAWLTSSLSSSTLLEGQSSGTPMDLGPPDPFRLGLLFIIHWSAGF
ncbi:uncharacterized protein LOC127926887 isoform X2 [Oncorhynchus keta]|uniref:uncharacterized protein LOC127926887 isoform X2 n=1 Tax=Oncorhynchus keta TaxID=8018 RepID=UPI00227C03D0|nr:uncharacterized protein LOC127926887 isoform X2 [Oncorhynchus keta]